VNISIVSVFPELFEPFIHTSLIKRAQQKGLLSIDLHSFFSFVEPKKRIDAPAFGPGAGMLIKPEVVERAVDHCTQKRGAPYTIFFSPHGKKLDQDLCKQIAHKALQKEHMLLLPARYEGMDARAEQLYADEIISIGDYVLMGGDLPAMVFLESILRYMPGVVGKEASVEHDSFSGPFVDWPSYTEPVEWHGKKVPDVLRSGNHKAIDDWRHAQAAQRTVKQHFGWLKTHVSQKKDKERAATYIPSHYVALCHTDVLVGSERVPGTTSVTSLDVHDIARSCKTFGIKGYSIVTPLADQQRIVQKLLDFWRSDVGIDYNPQRHGALGLVDMHDTVDQVVAAITEKEGVAPIVLATSARQEVQEKQITFFDQAKVWASGRPVLLLFGTGQGLSNERMQQVDYVLVPVEGMTDFNHLSVRSAAAIVLDRWLGLNPVQVR